MRDVLLTMASGRLGCVGVVNGAGAAAIASPAASAAGKPAADAPAWLMLCSLAMQPVSIVVTAALNCADPGAYSDAISAVVNTPP